MSGLWLYAIVAEPGARLPLGMAGESLRLLPAAGAWVVAGEATAGRGAGRAALEAHDRVVRELAEACEALLPCRFGQTVPSPPDLETLLAGRGHELRRALDLVRGCRQMDLRLFGGEPPASPEPASPDQVAERPASGTEFLRAKQRAHSRAAEVPELASLRSRLAPLVRASRARRHDRPPLLATVYDLVPRPLVEEYRGVVANHAVTPLALRLTGPWPPWSFGPSLAAGGAAAGAGE